MKPVIILIIGLLALAFVEPAMADREKVMDLTVSQGENNITRPLNVHFGRVVESDTSNLFSPYNYPPDKYKFITLYYQLINPYDKDVYYDFNVTIKDQAGRYFTGEPDPARDTVPAGQSYDRALYYAVYRNSTDLELAWYDKDPNPPWNWYYSYIPIEFTDATPTPSVTPTQAAPTSTPTPTVTPTQTTPSATACLPFLPLGLLIGSIGGLGILARKR